MSNIFTGFSTVGSTQQDSFKLYDLQLIQQDLMNHFHTRVGERVMRPEWGCRIWDYLDEPFSPLVKAEIAQEAVRICNAEPRVRVVDVQVTSDDHSIRVELLLTYLPFDVTTAFILDFENRQSQQGF